MARPTKPKDLKPKSDGAEVTALPGGKAGGGSPLDLKMIVMLLVMTLLTIGGTAGSTYLVSTMVIVPAIQEGLANVGGGEEGGEEGEGEEGEEHGPVSQVGMNLELDEFTVNLRPDPQNPGNQFLRAKLALSIKVPPEQDCNALGGHHAMAMPSELNGGTIAGAAAPTEEHMLASGGGAPDPAVACNAAFKDNMAKFVPTVRDIINAALMKRTATQLATFDGQEALKDEIKEEVSLVMAPNYSVLRVNFEDFIIQR